MISRQHVVDVLHKVHLPPEDERRLLDLPYPVPWGVVAREFSRLGLDQGALADRLGGSP